MSGPIVCVKDIHPKDADRAYYTAMCAMASFGVGIICGIFELWAMEHAWLAFGGLLTSRAARIVGDILWARLFLGLMFGQILMALWFMAALVGAH